MCSRRSLFCAVGNACHQCRFTHCAIQVLGEKPSSGKLDYCFQVVTGQMRNDLVWSYMCEHGKIEWKLRVGERGKERNAAGLAMEV